MCPNCCYPWPDEEHDCAEIRAFYVQATAYAVAMLSASPYTIDSVRTLRKGGRRSE